MTVINNYFDLGDFYIIKGYMHEFYQQFAGIRKV